METAPRTEASTTADRRAKSVPPRTDCATCKRRRIQCDRSPNACRKCHKKGLTCPGYGPRVQWVNDVASRGHLKGLQAAALRGQPRPGPGIVDLVETELPAGGRQSSSPNAPPLADLDELKRYYRDHIAPLMVWIDSEDNPYRTRIPAMVDTSPVLHLAVSAISALHWNATRQAEQVALPEDIRDEAVMRITESVRAITIDSTTHLDLEMAQWMLASMMVLSCCEMVKVGAMAADWHRRAARALVNVITTMSWRDDELLVFLMNQLAIYDVLSCTTSFDIDDLQAAILPTQQGRGPVFSRILSLIHETTLDSRRLLAAGRTEPPSSSSSSSSSWSKQQLSQLRCDIELARADTLMAASTVSFRSDAQRRDFVRLVDLHCTALILYTRRACTFDDPDSCLAAAAVVDDLFYALSTMEQSWSSCQNLSWPLFIAGTEVRDDGEKQEQVVAIFRDIHRLTGFDHFRELIVFLESFWSGSSNDWLSHAKDWEQRGRRILAV